ncbi:hypothetical protein GCM10010528_02740 [Gordonia defluvii]|jgi:hypothetical protein|uniref:T4 beta protein n=1 Tax=Gordonia defluvii TaxID=283718 RepID=A0ABN3YEX5_9ACTN|nr:MULTISPECIES: hypothetical protein [Gordonia]
MEIERQALPEGAVSGFGVAADPETVEQLQEYRGNDVPWTWPLLMRDRGGIDDTVVKVRSAGVAGSITIDPHEWNTIATVDRPTALTDSEGAGTLFDPGIQSWGLTRIKDLGIDAILTPSLLADRLDALSAVVEVVQEARWPVVPFIALDITLLDQVDAVRAALRPLRALTPKPGLALAVVGPFDGLAAHGRVAGLRSVLADHPGAWLVYVDPLVATDALSLGAAAAFVGAKSSWRRPPRPSASGGGPHAAGFIPGLFHRELLEMRSPAIYEDWYADLPTPVCPDCNTAVDSYTSDDEDKLAVVEHNLHAIDEFVRELNDREYPERAAWLRRSRADALAAHLSLTSGGEPIDADVILRRLCELDDPQQRRTTTSGAWL